jgi:hypothetical protein
MRITKNAILKAIIFIFLIQFSFIVKAQNVKDEVFEKEKLKFYKENTDTSKSLLLIRRGNRNSIVFSFFEEFNDTVVLFVNNKKQEQWLIYTKDNPTLAQVAD